MKKKECLVKNMIFKVRDHYSLNVPKICLAEEHPFFLQSVWHVEFQFPTNVFETMFESFDDPLGGIARLFRGNQKQEYEATPQVFQAEQSWIARCIFLIPFSDCIRCHQTQPKNQHISLFHFAKWRDMWAILAPVSKYLLGFVGMIFTTKNRLFPTRHLQRIARWKVKDTQFSGVARLTAWPWNTRLQLTQKSYPGLGEQVFVVCLEHVFFLSET